jgi:hypothetical protein
MGSNKAMMDEREEMGVLARKVLLEADGRAPRAREVGSRTRYA